MKTLLRRSLLSLALLAPMALASAPALAQEHGAPAHNVAEAVNKAVNEANTHTSAHGDEAARSGEALPGFKKGLVTALTTTVVFLILLFILTKVAFGPIAAGLKKREDKIRDDIENAEKKLAEANAVLAKYNQQVSGAEAQVRALMAEATANAEKIKASIKAQADAEAVELREKAKRDIQSEKDAALREIQEQAVYLSTAIAEKVLKRNLNAEDNRDLVRSSLEQLGTVNRN